MLPAGAEKPLEYLNTCTCQQWLGGENDLLKHLDLLHFCFITTLEKLAGRPGTLFLFPVLFHLTARHCI